MKYYLTKVFSFPLVLISVFALSIALITLYIIDIRSFKRYMDHFSVVLKSLGGEATLISCDVVGLTEKELEDVRAFFTKTIQSYKDRHYGQKG